MLSAFILSVPKNTLMLSVVMLCVAAPMMAFGANPVKIYSRDLRIFVISYNVCPWQAFPA
jgi:hypothetical protein